MNKLTWVFLVLMCGIQAQAQSLFYWDAGLSAGQVIPQGVTIDSMEPGEVFKPAWGGGWYWGTNKQAVMINERVGNPHNVFFQPGTDVGADQFDDISENNLVLQRGTAANWFRHRYVADPGRVFTAVMVTFMTLGQPSQDIFRLEINGITSGDGAGDIVPRLSIDYLGIHGNWRSWRSTYDLSAFNVDNFQYYIGTGSGSYQPVISSVKMWVDEFPDFLKPILAEGVTLDRMEPARYSRNRSTKMSRYDRSDQTPALIWYCDSEEDFTWAEFFYSDPLDDQSSKKAMQRNWDTTYYAGYYTAEKGNIFGSVSTVVAMTDADDPISIGELEFEYYDRYYDTWRKQSPLEVTRLGYVPAKSWTTYLLEYDFTERATEEIRMVLPGNTWYRPLVSSVLLETTSFLAADLSGDNRVDIEDLALFSAAWLLNYDPNGN